MFDPSAEASTAVLAAEVAQSLARLAMQPLLGDNPRAVAGLLRLLAAFVGSAARPDAVATVLEHCEVQLQCLQVGVRLESTPAACWMNCHIWDAPASPHLLPRVR